MNTHTSLPLPFKALEGKVSHVQKVNSNEYTSTCPSCKDIGHTGSSKPDRFIMWIHSDKFGGPYAWCRQCYYRWHPGLETGKTLSIEDRVRLEENRKKAIAEEIEAKRQALQNLKDSKIWLSYHNNLDEDSTRYWINRGIPEFFIEYWKLGYSPSHSFWSGDKEFVVSSYTIPYFTPPDREIANLKHRLVASIGGGKYRSELKGIPACLFYTDIDNEPKNSAIIVEGEIKAMVTYVTLDDPSIFVIGVPGKTPSIDTLQPLLRCDPVYVMLDPDAYAQGINSRPLLRMKDFLGDKMRVIMPPGKIDDCIIKYGLNKQDLINLMKYAIKY